MKRITAIIAAFVLTLTSLAACGNSDTPTSEVNPDSFSGTSATENPISSEDSSDVDNSVTDDEAEVSGETDVTDDDLPTVTTTADDDKTVPTTTTAVSGNDEEKPVTTTAEDKKDTAATTTSKKATTTTVKETTTTKKPTTTTKVTTTKKQTTTTKKQTTTTKVTTEKKPTTTTKKPEAEKPKTELTQADIDRLVKELQEYSNSLCTITKTDKVFEEYLIEEYGSVENWYDYRAKTAVPEECSWDSPVTIFKDISYEKALEYGKSQVEEAYYAFDSHAVVYARWCPKGKGCANEFWNSETGYTQEDCWDIYALI